MGTGFSKDHSLVFHAFTTKIYQVTGTNCRATQFVLELRPVAGLIGRVGFKLNDGPVFNQQGGGVITDDDAFEQNLGFWFKFNLQPARLGFHLHCPLINLFQKSKTKDIVNPASRADNLPRDRLKRVILFTLLYLCPICVHLWLKDGSERGADRDT